jgi:hypothetical protein
MIRRFKNLAAFTVLLLVLMLPGCYKPDTLPQLELLVVDENGDRVVGAYVAIFDTSEEWNKRVNPVQVWRRTNAEGIVSFVDLREIPYYFYVRYDGKDNSTDEISTRDSLVMNQRSKITVQIR